MNSIPLNDHWLNQPPIARRFATYEAAEKAIQKGDFSGEVPPFKSGSTEICEEYKEANFEMNYVTHLDLK